MKYCQILLFLVLANIVIGHSGCHFKNTPKDESILQRREENGERHLQAVNPQKLRMKFDASGLNSMNEEMRNYLIKTVKVAINFFNDLIKVKRPLTRPIRIGNEQSCHGLYTYSNLQRQQEYADTDLLIFVTYKNESVEDYVAYASGCQQDETGRNIIGIVNFNANRVKPSSDYQFQYWLQTTIHELFHVIALDSNLFGYYLSPNGRSYDQSLYYNNESILALPNVAKWAQKYYNCPSIRGMYLENEGGPGSAGSHWEMSLLYDDTMTASGDVVFWSGANNALLIDSGWYELNNPMEDNLTWGKGKGCEFFNNKCASQQKFREFCQNEGAEGYTFSYHAKAKCKNYTYDAKCKIFQNEKDVNCFDPASLKGPILLNEILGYDSRAFMSTIQPSTGTTTSSVRCYKYACANNNSQINITFGKETLTCTQSGALISSKDMSLKGQLTCPSIQDFCEKEVQCKNFCSSNGYCIRNQCVCLEGFSGPGCECKKGQVFSNGICQNQIQQDCGKNCLQCNNSQCSQCAEGFYLTGGNCVPCSSPCKTCDKSSTTCLSCVSNYSLFYNICTLLTDKNCDIALNPTTCKQCLPGKGLDNQGKCTLICNASCNTCSLQTTQCTTCRPGLLLVNGKCVCQEGSFLNDQQQCQKCTNNCKTCKNADTCDICNDSFSLNQQTKKCMINNNCQYFQFMGQDGRCQQCDSTCYSCEGSAKKCTRCYQGQILVNNKCTCGEGQYLYAGYCYSCGQDQEYVDGRCVCKAGFYMEPVYQYCAQCDEYSQAQECYNNNINKRMKENDQIKESETNIETDNNKQTDNKQIDNTQETTNMTFSPIKCSISFFLFSLIILIL